MNSALITLLILPMKVDAATPASGVDSIISHLAVILGAVLSLAVLATAVGIVVSAKKASYKDTARVSFTTIIGCAMAAFAGIGLIAFGTGIIGSLGVN